MVYAVINYNKNGERLIYFDSLRNSRYDKKDCDLINNFLSGVSILISGNKRLPITPEIAIVPMQPQTYDCGVYALHYMEKLMQILSCVPQPVIIYYLMSL